MAHLFFKNSHLLSILLICFASCGNTSTHLTRSESTTKNGEDREGVEMSLKKSERLSENVIDLRPKSCAIPKNCSAGFMSNQCTARPASAGTTGWFNSGLCEVDANEKLTSICHMEQRCCTTPSEGPGVGGCDYKIVQPKNPCDNSQCQAKKVISENKFLCFRVTQTGACTWVWSAKSWRSVCDETGSLITKGEGCAR